MDHQKVVYFVWNLLDMVWWKFEFDRNTFLQAQIHEKTEHAFALVSSTVLYLKYFCLVKIEGTCTDVTEQSLSKKLKKFDGKDGKTKRKIRKQT